MGIFTEKVTLFDEIKMIPYIPGEKSGSLSFIIDQPIRSSQFYSWIYFFKIRQLSISATKPL